MDLRTPPPTSHHCKSQDGDLDEGQDRKMAAWTKVKILTFNRFNSFRDALLLENNELAACRAALEASLLCRVL